jgi:hypothetical protein
MKKIIVLFLLLLFSVAAPLEARTFKVASYNVEDLFDLIDSGNVSYLLQSCVVIYKHEENAIIKQDNGRAIFVYKAGRTLEYGKIYDLTVKELHDYHGLREITAIAAAKEIGQADNSASHLLNDPSADFSGPGLQNEVISEVKGVYKKGYFYYG